MTKTTRLKLLRLFIGLSFVFVMLAAFTVEKVLPYYGIKPYRMIAAENTWRFPRGYMPENYGLAGRKMTVTTRDSLQLSAWFLPAQGDSVKGTVIILHGIGSCKETQFPRASILAGNGFNCVALDLRAHGESGGEYCTFGFYEKEDIAAVVDTLQRMTNGKPVGIWGASLGGAVALQAMGADRRIAFGIIESTFDEFEKVAIEYGADMMLGIRSKWLTDHVIGKSGNIARFDPQKVKPVVSAAAINRPMLFMHGDHDDKIPIEFGRRNFEAVPSAQKQWIVVPGGGHSNLWRAHGDQLSAHTIAFLNSLELH